MPWFQIKVWLHMGPQPPSPLQGPPSPAAACAQLPPTSVPTDSRCRPAAAHHVRRLVEPRPLPPAGPGDQTTPGPNRLWPATSPTPTAGRGPHYRSARCSACCSARLYAFISARCHASSASCCGCACQQPAAAEKRGNSNFWK
jgi:hypothetical protein